MYRVTLHYDGETVAAPLLARHTVLGSSPQADVRLPVAHVSRRHAAIIRHDDRFILRDLDSHNGTFVHGARIQETELEPLTEFTLGPVVGLIEEVSTADFQPGLALRGRAASPTPRAFENTQTAETSSRAALIQEILAPIVATADLDQASAARRCGQAMTTLLPRLGLRIEARGVARGTVVLFDSSAASRPDPESHGADARVHDERSCFEVAMRAGGALHVAWRGALSSAVRDTVEVVAALLACMDHERAPVAPASDPAGAAHRSRSRVLGCSAEVHALLAYCERIAPMPINLLILGESGTGKELFASELHRLSARCDAPFIAINCAALPRDLLEAELFGIEEKVATGVDARSGRFEQAHGGTLFLDEVCDMSLSTQAMILRVLQEKSFYPIGGRNPRSVDVRIVAATNKDIEAEIRAQRFRQDLYYRIAGDTIHLPPLRQRHGDVSVLLHHFLERFVRELERPIAGVSRKALDLLVAYPWPGNIRELENEVRRLVALAPPRGLIEASHLSSRIRAQLQSGIQVSSQGQELPLQDALAVFERQLIEDALAETEGNIAAAARRLCISRPGLYQRMERLGIDVTRSR